MNSIGLDDRRLIFVSFTTMFHRLINRDLVNNFRDALAEQVGLTIDYDSLDVPGRVIIFDTLALDVDEDSVETFLDFLVVQAP